MATVTGYTAEHMDEIANTCVVDGNVVAGELILVQRDLTEINAGSVIGPTGATGPAGPTSIVVCTSGTRPTGGALFNGLVIYETDTNRMYTYNGATWRAISAQDKVLISGAQNVVFATVAAVSGTLTFGVTFAVAPIVVATPIVGFDSDVIINWTALPTTTGVAFRCVQKSNANLNLTVTLLWQAHGELA